mmetsp:Transcript_32870/g.72599  ORF Transcript_32870/g.72599 Transcript_32870/m.72599 type:complete len:91 (+) Transcript_32870:160-432(+)
MLFLVTCEDMWDEGNVRICGMRAMDKEGAGQHASREQVHYSRIIHAIMGHDHGMHVVQERVRAMFLMDDMISARVETGGMYCHTAIASFV